MTWVDEIEARYPLPDPLGINTNNAYVCRRCGHAYAYHGVMSGEPVADPPCQLRGEWTHCTCFAWSSPVDREGNLIALEAGL